MKPLRITLILLLSLVAAGAQAQKADDVATQKGIVAALPKGVIAATATADQIAQAATDYAFGKSSKETLEANVTQVTVALGEMTRAGTFKNAPRFGDSSPPNRFYTKVINLASSNLDVSSSTYYALTVQDMTRLAAAVRAGQNFLNGAKSNAITRK